MSYTEEKALTLRVEVSFFLGAKYGNRVQHTSFMPNH